MPSTTPATPPSPFFKTREIVSLLALWFISPTICTIALPLFGLSKGFRAACVMAFCALVGFTWGIAVGIVVYIDKPAFIWECDQTLGWCRIVHEVLLLKETL